MSSHDLSVRQAYDLSRVLGRAPKSVVLVTVDAADTGHGQGLSPAVASALPDAVDVVLRVLVEETEKEGHQQT